MCYSTQKKEGDINNTRRWIKKKCTGHEDWSRTPLCGEWSVPRISAFRISHFRRVPSWFAFPSFDVCRLLHRKCPRLGILIHRPWQHASKTLCCRESFTPELSIISRESCDIDDKTMKMIKMSSTKLLLDENLKSTFWQESLTPRY